MIKDKLSYKINIKDRSTYRDNEVPELYYAQIRGVKIYRKSPIKIGDFSFNQAKNMVNLICEPFLVLHLKHTCGTKYQIPHDDLQNLLK